MVCATSRTYRLATQFSASYKSIEERSGRDKQTNLVGKMKRDYREVLQKTLSILIE
jgi:hypothetical protein